MKKIASLCILALALAAAGCKEKPLVTEADLKPVLAAAMMDGKDLLLEGVIRQVPDKFVGDGILAVLVEVKPKSDAPTIYGALASTLFQPKVGQTVSLHVTRVLEKYRPSMDNGAAYRPVAFVVSRMRAEDLMKSGQAKLPD